MSGGKITKNIVIGLGALLALVAGIIFWMSVFNQFNKSTAPTVQPVSDVYGSLEKGRWGWAIPTMVGSCSTNPHTIQFQNNNTEAVLHFKSKIYSADGSVTNTALYKIIEKNGNRITMRIVGEKRLDEKGRPVVWDLVMLNENEYVWHRLDWRPGELTSRVHRCTE